MNLYQTRYGRGSSTSRPQFTLKGNNVYASTGNKNFSGDRNVPIFEKRGDKIYRTNHHPEGASAHAVYEIKGEDVYRTLHHSEGKGEIPDFKIKKESKISSSGRSLADLIK